MRSGQQVDTQGNIKCRKGLTTSVQIARSEERIAEDSRRSIVKDSKKSNVREGEGAPRLLIQRASREKL